MSGLAAGIRLAHYDQKVCILERHYTIGVSTVSIDLAAATTMSVFTLLPTTRRLELKKVL